MRETAAWSVRTAKRRPRGSRVEEFRISFVDRRFVATLPAPVIVGLVALVGFALAVFLENRGDFVVVVANGGFDLVDRSVVKGIALAFFVVGQVFAQAGDLDLEFRVFGRRAAAGIAGAGRRRALGGDLGG